MSQQYDVIVIGISLRIRRGYSRSPTWIKNRRC